MVQNLRTFQTRDASWIYHYRFGLSCLSVIDKALSFSVRKYEVQGDKPFFKKREIYGSFSFTL